MQQDYKSASTPQFLFRGPDALQLVQLTLNHTYIPIPMQELRAMLITRTLPDCLYICSFI